jgi:serine/threonine-protein kinase
MEKTMTIRTKAALAEIAGPAARPSFPYGGSAMQSFGSDNRRATSNLQLAKPPSNDPQIGDLLDGRFKILNVINRGGMAWVYEALDGDTGRTVALKVPLMRFESDPGYFSRFQREENIGLTLDHPCVLKFFAAGVKSRPYLVMERLDGETLAARLRREPRLPENEAVRIVSQICDALEYLHRKGIVHRDLKPDNIMLCADGSLRILDFGIAKSENARRLTFGSFSATMGTPDYISPEQIQGKRGDSRTDIYSLGAMLYEMTTGSTPYEGDNAYVIMNARLTGDPQAPRERNPQLSPQIEEIILHAMERQPSERFPSAAAMRAELVDYSEVDLTGRSQKLQAPQLWKTRFPLLPKILLFAGLQIAAFLLLFWWLSSHTHHHSTVTPAPPAAVDGRVLPAR